MRCKLLVKMDSKAQSLENVMAAVRQNEFAVRNLTARLSLDETLFFLTLEVEGKESSSTLTDQIVSMNEVMAVENLGA